MMKCKNKIQWYISIMLFINASYSFAQDSKCVIQTGELVKYRNGFIVTTTGDTIQGSLYHESDTGLFFIPKSKTIETTLFGKRSRVPYITANSNIISAFYRNGILYETTKVPPYNQFVYLAVIENGPLKLYGLIYNYSDKKTSDHIANTQLLGWFGALLLDSEEETEEEYFNIKSHYIQKGNNNEIILMPKGKRKFRKVFIPLVSDNNVFLQRLYGKQIDYFNIFNLVKLYNSTYPRD